MGRAGYGEVVLLTGLPSFRVRRICGGLLDGTRTHARSLQEILRAVVGALAPVRTRYLTERARSDTRSAAFMVRSRVSSAITISRPRITSRRRSRRARAARRLGAAAHSSLSGRRGCPCARTPSRAGRSADARRLARAMCSEEARAILSLLNDLRRPWRHDDAASAATAEDLLPRASRTSPERTPTRRCPFQDPSQRGRCSRTPYSGGATPALFARSHSWSLGFDLGSRAPRGLPLSSGAGRSS